VLEGRVFKNRGEDLVEDVDALGLSPSEESAEFGDVRRSFDRKGLALACNGVGAMEREVTPGGPVGEGPASVSPELCGKVRRVRIEAEDAAEMGERSSRVDGHGAEMLRVVDAGGGPKSAPKIAADNRADVRDGKTESLGESARGECCSERPDLLNLPVG
jgi:hypothetical protein